MRVFVTRRVPLWEQVAKPLVDAGIEVVVYGNNHRIDRKELELELEKGYDGLLCLLTEKIDSDLLGHDRDKKLKIVANYAVGYDNVDVASCKAAGIAVTNTPSDVVNQSVAEFTLALIMSLIKGLPAAADFAHNVGYKGWEPDVFLGKNAKDKVLGVIGAGRIGGMVATMASAVGFGVMTFSRNSGTRLEEVLAKSDVVTLHVPLTPETKHMINARTMEQMKAGAYLVNTARGPVVDEADLVAALKSGRLAGAALDVWENEPSPRPELVEMENVILTPHVASATIEARKAMGEVAVANLLAGLTGQVPPNLVKE